MGEMFAQEGNLEVGGFKTEVSKKQAFIDGPSQKILYMNRSFQKLPIL